MVANHGMYQSKTPNDDISYVEVLGVPVWHGAIRGRNTMCCGDIVASGVLVTYDLTRPAGIGPGRSRLLRNGGGRESTVPDLRPDLKRIE